MDINLTLFMQAAAFAVFIWLTARFVWPPLMRAIETRQKHIAEGLTAGEQGRQELELAGKRASEELAQARARAAEIVSHADQRALRIIEDAKVTAREEGNREKTAAKAEIAQEVSRVKESLRSQIGAIAVAGAEKILRREVDAKTHADLLKAIETEL